MKPLIVSRKTFIFIFFLAVYICSFHYLLSPKATISRAQKHELSKWSISPYLMEAMAGEFKGVFADWLTMETGARLANPDIKIRDKDWPSIVRLFHLSIHMDPYFLQLYALAQGWLPWSGNSAEETAWLVQETNKILEVAATHRNWDWRPKYYQAFNTYYFLKDYGTAGKIMLEAGKTPNSPVFLSILGARLSLKGGDTQTAILLLKSLLAQRTHTDPDYQYISERLTALEGVYIIEQALLKYKSLTGSPPQHIDDLLQKNILTALPPNPYGDEYCLNKEGRVFFDKFSCSQ